ncbi:MAG: Cdc6/Cdc18 family protein [Candidatus Njordarchaeales archaeon]
MVSKTILIKPKTLSHTFIPPKLPIREAERSELTENLLDFFTSDEAYTSWSLIGSVGIGKTVLSRRVGKDLQEQINQFKLAYVNCRFSRRVYKVLVELVSQIEPSIPPRGLSRDDILNILLEILEEKGEKVLIILDEFDALFWESESRKARDLIYGLSRLVERRFGSPSKNVSLAVIAISRESELYKWLDRAARASFIRRELRLKPYNASDLFEILKYRADLAFLPGTVEEDSLELIANQVAELENGNARIAIDILVEAGKLADKKGDGFLGSEHVRTVLSQHPMTPQIDPETLSSLGKHKLLIILAIVRALKATKKSFVTRTEMEEFYEILCDEYNETPRKTTQILRYLREIKSELKGAIDIEVTGRGQRGRSSRISITIPLDKLENYLIKILEFAARFKRDIT